MKQVIELSVTRDGVTSTHAALMEMTEHGPALDSPIELQVGDVLEFRAEREGEPVDIEFTVQ